MEINPIKPPRHENPIITFPDSTYSGQGEKSISGQFEVQSDNPQSTILLPEGGRVTAQVVYSESATNAKIDLLLRQPGAETLLEYANNNIGYTWVSEGYPPNTNLEFGIYWYWNYWGAIYQGNEAGALITQLEENKYRIGFEAAGDDWDYNELIIEVTIDVFELLVQIDPPNISTGETAVVTVKKQFYDGRIGDFPLEQLFEFGMLEGCMAGALVFGSDTAAYFDNATQPILFVAADSIENNADTVLIGVGLIQQSQNMKMSSNSNKENYLDKSQQSDLNEDGIITPDGFTPMYCFPGDIYSEMKGYSNLVVGNVCATLSKCTENNAGKKPNFEIMDFPDGTDGNYVCNNVSGITFMLWSENEKKLFLPIEIENCYDENANVIQFGIKDDLITLRTIVTACEDIIIGQGYTILYNTTELKTKVPQNLTALTRLYLDLDIFLDYFTKERPNAPAYYPIELAWEHEFEHKRRYVDSIFNIINKDFDYLDYSRLDVSCGKYGNMNDVLGEMKYNFEKKFSYFEKESNKYERKVWGKKDGTPKEIENYKKNENETHNAIAPRVIGEYKNQIKVLMKQLLN